MKKIVFILLFLHSVAALSQDGSIDPTFDAGTGADQNVYIVKELSDGKIIVGGQFMDFNGTGRKNLVRLNPDGSIDQTFNSPQDLPNFTLLKDAIEDNGKLVVVGEFGMFSGVTSSGIIRLNSDGSVDPTFNVGTGIAGLYGISNLSKQGDKYILTGNFSAYSGTQCGNIIRLNQNGTVDETFTSLVSDTGFDATITAHRILPDGKILIAGNFTSHNGVPFTGIGRLNANGEVDLSFNPGTGANGTVISVAVQSDGKYIIAGMFSQYNGVDKPLVARINADGTLDNSFSRDPLYRLNGSSLLIQPDGKILATGFQTGMSSYEKYIVRMRTDGSIDPTFNSDIDNVINASSFQQDGKILVGGWFGHAGAQPVGRVARLQNEGSLETREFSATAAIYPNPVADLAHVDFDQRVNYVITVCDVFGKQLEKISGSDHAAGIDFSKCQSGMYLLRIECDNATTIKKIIKQ